MRDRVNFDPDYQRSSDIWNLEKRQLLIDTVINGFDVPKLYFHKHLSPDQRGGRRYDYAIVDGKQRLETIFSFIEGKIALSDNFEYLADKSINVSGMTYEELALNYPDLKADFDGFQLHVVSIETNDVEIIEEMFSRLNEAVPLSAPEKRNAFGGPVPQAIRKLSREEFFKDKLPFSNSRYRHFDVATKFLYFESQGGVFDTKKTYLDDFVKSFSKEPKNMMPDFFDDARRNVKRMTRIFVNKDPLLRQVGMVALYYLLFQRAEKEGWLNHISRKRLLDFDGLRRINRDLAEKDIGRANYKLLEFDRLSQSPNDAFALDLRLSTLIELAFSDGHSG